MKPNLVPRAFSPFPQGECTLEHLAGTLGWALEHPLEHPRKSVSVAHLKFEGNSALVRAWSFWIPFMFYEYFSRQLHDISFSVQHSFSGSLMVPESWSFGCARGRVREYLFSKSTHACRIYTFFKITQAPNPPRQKSSSATPWFSCFMFVNKKNSRKGNGQIKNTETW